MKRFICIFVIIILTLGFFIGQCNDDEDIVHNDDIVVFVDKTKIEELPPSTSEVSLDNNTNNRKDESTFDNSLRITIIPPNISHQLLIRTAYITSYNNSTKCPNWVAWHLTAEHADGEIARDTEYYEDLDVPAPRATNEDYRRSGWSRGHMCPAGDNKWDETAMRESNLLTNICPQNRELNSGVWNVIERDCRKWAKKYGDVYIVCGPVLLNREHETIGENKVVVPEAFFKVILRMNPKPAAIGFVIRNNEGKKKKDMFVNTVDDVERITGYDFFSALPDDIEDVVEANARLEDWK